MHTTAYYATDRRYYNGAPSDDLWKEQNHINKLTVAMKKLDPEARSMYFPAEGKYMIFTGNAQLLPKMYECKQRAMIEAIELLKRRIS